MPEYARDALKHTVVQLMVATGECSMNEIDNAITHTVTLAHPDDPLAHWWLSITREEIIDLACEIFGEVFEELYPF
jgi:hypothetical protein